MLDTTLGIATLAIACAAFLVLGVSYAWRRRRQSVEDYTISRNHAPVNVGIATVVASMFGTWVLLSPGETGANFGIVALVGYGLGMAGIPVMFMFVGPRIPGADAQRPLHHRVRAPPFRHGSVHRHRRHDNFRNRHIHYRRDGGDHQRGERADQLAQVGNRRGRGRSGDDLHRLWGPAHVHLHRPDPVLGADAGDTAAGGRGGGHGERTGRNLAGRRRGRPAVRGRAGRLLLQHRADYRHRRFQRLPSGDVAAGLYH